MLTDEQRRVLVEVAQMFPGTDRRRQVLNELAAHNAGATTFAYPTIGHWLTEVAGDREVGHVISEMTHMEVARQAFAAGRETNAGATTEAAGDGLFEDDDERRKFANACDDFATCNETGVDYNLLMKWANNGLLECTHFDVTEAGNAEIERIERAGEGS